MTFTRNLRLTAGLLSVFAVTALLACTKSGGGGGSDSGVQAQEKNCMASGEVAAMGIPENGSGVIGFWEYEGSNGNDDGADPLYKHVSYVALSPIRGVQNISGNTFSKDGCVKSFNGGNLESTSATSAKATLTDQMLNEARESGNAKPEDIEKAQREGLATYTLEASDILIVKYTFDDKPDRYRRVKASVAIQKTETLINNFKQGKELGLKFVQSLQGKRLRLISQISQTKDASGTVKSHYETPASQISESSESIVNGVATPVYNPKLIVFTGLNSARVADKVNDNVTFISNNGILFISMNQPFAENSLTGILQGSIEKTDTTVSITQSYKFGSDQTQETIYQFAIEKN